MKYQVVYDKDIVKLEECVNQKIECGWIPQGGIHTIQKAYNNSVVSMYAQAMVTKDKE